MCKTAILIATFNGEKWLKEQLLSIAKQQNVDASLFVSDDQSIDGTVKVTEELIQTYGNIHLLTSKNKFGSAAQNFFRLIRDVDFSQFSHIALSDQDDFWQPRKLALAIETIREKGVDGYSSNVRAFWPDGSSKLIDKAQPQMPLDYMFESAGPGCTFVLTQKMALELQKFIIEKHDSLKSIALHDWFIYAFARSRGYKWHIDPTPTLSYRQHADNVVGANTGFKAIKARLSKLRQGWYIKQIILIAESLGYQNSEPIYKISRLNIFDRLYMAMFAYRFRRRFRDRLAFAFFVLFLAKKP